MFLKHHPHKKDDLSNTMLIGQALYVVPSQVTRSSGVRYLGIETSVLLFTKLKSPGFVSFSVLYLEHKMRSNEGTTQSRYLMQVRYYVNIAT